MKILLAFVAAVCAAGPPPVAKPVPELKYRDETVATALATAVALEKQGNKTGELTYLLGRLYATAYADPTAKVRVEDKSGVPAFLSTAPVVPATIAAGPHDRTQLEQAFHYFMSAYSKLDKLPAARLGMAWCIEQRSLLMEALAAYRKALDEAWHAERARIEGGKRLPKDFHSVTLETTEHLLPLLDPKAEAAEIRKVKALAAKARKATAAAAPRKK